MSNINPADRIGERYYTHQGYEIEIIEYFNSELSQSPSYLRKAIIE